MRSALEFLLYNSGLARLARAHNRGRTIVLAYHNILPEGAPNPGEQALHLAREEFSRQLDLLTDTHEVVSLEEGVQKPSSKSSRPRVVITFDDAYQGAMTAGITELTRRGLPATVFVSPTYVGGESFWWDELAASAAEEEWDEFRKKAIENLGGIAEDVRRKAGKGGFKNQPIPEYARCCSMEELRKATENAAITLGAHSWSHPDLTQLDESELERQLVRPLVWLREHFPEASVPWIAYPYGITSPKVETLASQAGYIGGFRLAPNDWLPQQLVGNSRFSLPRFSIPQGMSVWAFGLRTAGL